MKKNIFGFTLVELLAAIVILGVLSTVAFTSITRMIDSNKNKIYINDAKRLIAYVEYKLKSDKKLSKPTMGNAIVISLGYLNNQDISNGPNNGEYEKDRSFVVVKNNSGKLEYAVLLIEKLNNGGYKGLDLTKDTDFSTASSRIHSFTETDLVEVPSLQVSSINTILGETYISGSISHIYS